MQYRGEEEDKKMCQSIEMCKATPVTMENTKYRPCVGPRENNTL